MLKKTLPLAAAIALALSPISSVQAANAMDGTKANFSWWPDKLDLTKLRAQSPVSNPMDPDFNYEAAFNSLDLAAVKADLKALMTDSQDWWPADYGHYGPFFVRMAWHAAGTYRMFDGRGGSDGGQQRFEPLNSWPDNVSLDKARRLLWPIKQKYGSKISWADLMILAGNVAMQDMGFTIYGYGGGRVDDWEADTVYWGPEQVWLGGAARFHGERKLEKPLAATQMGLIYVNPEGPDGKPDPLLAAKDIRRTFGGMAMNDEETVALIAGGHTFGKAHGAHKPEECVGAEPAAADVEQQGFGWKNKCGKGNAEDTVTSGLEGAWSVNPTAWTMQYLDNLFNFEWVPSKSPAGATQWVPKNADNLKIVPDAHVEGKRHAPIMFTTDLSLKFDPEYRKIAMRFKENPKEFELAFGKAWFKLTHRDMGPTTRYLGPDVPKDMLIWQDPVPKADYPMVSASDVSMLKKAIKDADISQAELIRTAWAAAASFRSSDNRGGANGARLALAPQKDWEVNNPKEIQKVLKALQSIRMDFNRKHKDGAQISLADMIVLGGAVGVETAAKKGGYDVTVPFSPGRTDASPAQTDVDSFAVLEPKADGFRNYYKPGTYADYPSFGSPAEMLVDKASMLNLSAPEMTVLIGGLRVLDANTGGSKHGVFTSKPGTLSNDFFVNLLDMSTMWSKGKTDGVYEGKDRKTGKVMYTATPVDLIFGSNSELRAVAEYYALNDSKEKFVNDFVAAWSKVMKLDRFDL